ncbi:hypothetical protein NB701_004394 [Pantoea ananatis]|nr:hypothetical protein [Pantoea ananatis]MCW0351032.1 hypothetical protein [Pantoea ananatis]
MYPRQMNRWISFSRGKKGRLCGKKTGPVAIFRGLMSSLLATHPGHGQYSGKKSPPVWSRRVRHQALNKFMATNATQPLYGKPGLCDIQLSGEVRFYCGLWLLSVV